VTLLTPLKHLTTFKLSKLPIFAGAATLRRQPLDLTSDYSHTEQLDPDLDQPTTPILTETNPDPLPLTSAEIMGQIGDKLRQWREHYHLSIDDMSARTQIQPRLIQAIEEGYIEVLPEPIYTKGMVKRYADSLGLDGAKISQHVTLIESAAPKFKVIPRSTMGFNKTLQFKPSHVYLGYMVAICAIGAGTSHFLNNAIKPPAPILNQNTVQLQRTATVGPIASQLPDVRIGIAVTDVTWAQIGIDGTTKVTGSLKAGTQFNWIAKKQVTISTNNAGGLLFSRDGQQPQLLGKIGQKQTITIKVSK
jgi:cytoskeletal protein RodZ